MPYGGEGRGYGDRREAGDWFIAVAPADDAPVEFELTASLFSPPDDDGGKDCGKWERYDCAKPVWEIPQIYPSSAPPRGVPYTGASAAMACALCACAAVSAAVGRVPFGAARRRERRTERR